MPFSFCLGELCVVSRSENSAGFVFSGATSYWFPAGCTMFSDSFIIHMSNGQRTHTELNVLPIWQSF